jgi:hypothetical protein
MGNAHAAHWQLPLASWAAWSEEGEDGPRELPKLDFVEPMLRRRLSALSKISLWVAHQCAQEVADARMIYASQHGEIVRTTDMLRSLAEHEPLSPTAFSLSVLNASIGLYSILRGNCAPATAIAAGAETLGYALLEAHGQLSRDPDNAVLVIYADESVPDLWQAANKSRPQALALLLRNDAKTVLECVRNSVATQTSSPHAQLDSLLPCLQNGQMTRWNNAHCEWQWQIRPA